MNCPKCGNYNQDNALFCNACGTQLGAGSFPGQSGNTPALVTLNCLQPIQVNPAQVAMFRVEKNSIALEMDGIWGEKMVNYVNVNQMYEDCGKLFTALQQLTNNMVMQFKSPGGPVVPIYRMTRVHLDEWWKKLEVSVEGAGDKWFQYQDKNTLFADHAALMELMQSGQLM
jgi:hypothetical protein